MNDDTNAGTTTEPVKPPEAAGETTPTPAAAAPEAPAATGDQPPAEATPTPDAADRPSDRIKVGGEAGAEKTADLKPKPVNPVTEGEATPAPTGKAYPPPNARSAPTDEEEAELAKLMEGASTDEVLSTAAAEAPKELEPGSKHKGKVVKVSGDSVFVELGTHLQGVVPVKQFEPKKAITDGPTQEAAEGEAKEGEAKPEEAAAPKPIDAVPGIEHAPDVDAEIEVMVVGLNDDESLYDLKLPAAAEEIGDWDEVESGKVVEVTITGHNKGGLECKVSGIRGFMPMGQISLYRVENPEEFVGQRLKAVITEANRGRKNVILSHRAVMEREREAKKDQLLAELKPGQLRDGVVRSLRDFGAFVDLGGVDGLVHVSKLSWDRIGHPREVLKEGETIKVKIEKIDPESGKIALSYREAAANPWDSAEADYPVGSSVTGKVTKTMDFGAFVRLGPGVEGLIHISELDHKRVNRVTDVVEQGKEVEAKVLSVDRQKQRIALSLKALSAAPARADKPSREPEPDEPRPERKKFKNLKGGTGSGSGGEQFGLKW